MKSLKERIKLKKIKIRLLQEKINELRKLSLLSLETTTTGDNIAFQGTLMQDWTVIVYKGNSKAIYTDVEKVKNGIKGELIFDNLLQTREPARNFREYLTNTLFQKYGVKASIIQSDYETLYSFVEYFDRPEKDEVKFGEMKSRLMFSLNRDPDLKDALYYVNMKDNIKDIGFKILPIFFNKFKSEIITINQKSGITVQFFVPFSVCYNVFIEGTLKGKALRRIMTLFELYKPYSLFDVYFRVAGKELTLVCDEELGKLVALIMSGTGANDMLKIVESEFYPRGYIGTYSTEKSMKVLRDMKFPNMPINESNLAFFG